MIDLNSKKALFYKEKCLKVIKDISFPTKEILSDDNFQAIIESCILYTLSYQEIKRLLEIERDLKSWGEESFFKNLFMFSISNKMPREKFLESYAQKYNRLILSPKKYSRKAKRDLPTITFEIVPTQSEAKILGPCPVASEKTICCNLLTLDTVINCSLGCSYCSIQVFQKESEVKVENNLKEKLEKLEIKKDEIYHIGTGQSSDSLLVGNSYQIFDHLIDFANNNPNVILEFKTKTANIGHFKKRRLPPNILFTWSINPQVIIENEEGKGADLDKRLEAARDMADSGQKVGFHFHPMIQYEGASEDYKELAKKIMDKFEPSEVATISFGTLTFTKKVVNAIKKSGNTGKILQMPLEEVAGKLSYPIRVKEEMFSNLYQSFLPWHNDVFFYLCMEPKEIWQSVFKTCYKDNLTFEHSMKKAYWEKIYSTDLPEKFEIKLPQANSFQKESF